MTAILGNTLLLLALAFTVYSLSAVAWHIRRNDGRVLQSGQNALTVSAVFTIFSSFALLRELLVSNFNIAYVARYSSAQTPFIYKFSGLWAGMEGSLLFWLAILGVCNILVVFQNRKEQLQLYPWVLVTLAFVQLFFLIMSNFFENPFTPIPEGVMTNGMGLNPLLQHPAMLIHPPTLYFGFIGFTVPFAYAVAAMITRQLDAGWIRLSRRWTLTSWMFLTLSIVMGGKWAYVELGWGGYWAWDPVENASLLPWLTGTAFLHSVLIQEKKNMLRIWNMVLIMLTFTLTIFGTYITRSGVVSSIHAFAATKLGIWFFSFILFIILFNAVLLFIRRKDLASDNKLESFVSRESGFLFNNMLFMAMMLTVLWGTMYPLISAGISGVQITVGSPYFNRVMIPLGLITVMLTGIGPLLAWRRTSGRSLLRNFLIPAIAGLAAAAVFSTLFGIRLIYPIISIVLVTFVATTIFAEFWKGMNARRRIAGESPAAALVNLFRKNRSRYGGYVVHLGVVMMFVGFTGKAFDQEADVSIRPGDVQTFGVYDVAYTNYWLETPESNPRTRPNHAAKIAQLEIQKNGQPFTEFLVEKRFYTDQNNQPQSEVSVKSTLLEDFYVIMGGMDTNTGEATMKIRINPMVSWVWIGTLVIILGTLVSLDLGGLLRRRQT